MNPHKELDAFDVGFAQVEVGRAQCDGASLKTRLKDEVRTCWLQVNVDRSAAQCHVVRLCSACAVNLWYSGLGELEVEPDTEDSVAWIADGEEGREVNGARHAHEGTVIAGGTPRQGHSHC